MNHLADKEKMKEKRTPPGKVSVKVTAIRAMTEEEERRFTAAIDALLAHWARRQDSRLRRGDHHVQQDGNQEAAHCGATS